MRDITDIMDHYRVVARSVWNFGFSVIDELRNWDSRDHFDQIEKLVFKALVDARLANEHACDLATVPEHEYHIVPQGVGPVPILIQCPREGDRNRYWDDPVKEVKASDAEFHFLDFFDWDQLGYADFQYYRVRIVAFPSKPHLVGREALIEHKNARVVLDVG